MADILSEIAERTREDLVKRRREVSLRELESFRHYDSVRLNFKQALKKEHSVSIIAEIKKASPSKGEIRADFNPVSIAKSYMRFGADAISVLTDEPFFKGKLAYLEHVATIKTVPVLRKDFILDPYQVKEARAFGADAILLIATMYNGNQLNELLASAAEFDIQALVECYHDEEIKSLVWKNIDLVGVNNRNLKTFEVDLHRGVELLQQAPEGVVRISESGITSPEDLLVLCDNRIHSALIGEHFMKQADPGEALENLINKFTKLQSIKADLS